MNEIIAKNQLPDIKTIKKFEEEFKPFSLRYRAAMKETETKIRILNEDFKLRHNHNPIEYIETRVKSTESLMNKMIKYNIPFNIEDLKENIFDIAGIRIVCSFISDIYHLVDMIEQNEDITVINKKDYIANPKDSGYRSFHLIVKVPIFLTTGREEVYVEIQIRTIAMDFWASLEHKIRYKFKGIVPDLVLQELVACSETVAKTDSEMMRLNEIVKSVNQQ